MGFFDVLKNVASGKPGFEPPSEPSSSVNNNSNQNQTQPTQSRQKIIPRVQIERVEIESDPSRSHMRVRAHIQNDSEVVVKIDRTRVLGYERNQGDRSLNPGQSFEFNVYEGPRPTQTGGANDDAYVIFEDISGDYFESQHRVEFNKEADNTWSIKRIIYTAPKDIQ